MVPGRKSDMQRINPPCVLLWNDFSKVDLTSFVSESEITRANKMKSEKRRAAFLAGRALLRQSFASLGLKLPDELPQIASGKPHVPGLPHFNISHTGYNVAVAIDASYEVGVDIETQDLKRDFAAIAKEYGSSQEQALLAKLGKEEAAQLFFKVWSMKEAFAKATGEGLSTGVAELEFDFSSGKARLNKDVGPLTFFYSTQNELHLSLCRRGQANPSPYFYEVEMAASGFKFQLLQDVEFQKFE